MAKKTFDWQMYRYTPSLIGPIISIIIFSILTALHLWQWLKTRRFIIVWITVGSLCTSICNLYYCYLQAYTNFALQLK